MFFLIHIRRSYETYKLQNIPPSHKKGQAHTDTGINLYIKTGSDDPWEVNVWIEG